MTSVKMEKRGFVLSCRKGQSRDRGDGIGKGCQEISLWWVRFLRQIFGSVFYINRLFYSCYSLSIPSNNSKIRNQDAWLSWFSVIRLTEKNEYWVHSVCVSWVSEKEGLQVSMQDRMRRRGNETPLQNMLVWNLVFVIRWDKLFSFNSFFEIQLTEKIFLEVLI